MRTFDFLNQRFFEQQRYVFVIMIPILPRSSQIRSIPRLAIRPFLQRTFKK